MEKECVLYDNKKCTDCGECNMCDLNSAKKCDNCGACIDNVEEYRSLNIDEYTTLLEDKNKFKKGEKK